MRNLGKAVGLILMLWTAATAGISAYVDAANVQSGDSVTFTIESDAENTRFPKISRIGEYAVLSSPSSKSIQTINGKTLAKLSQSYIFQPIKDVTIPAFEVRVNGAVVKTEPITISVSKRTQTLGKPYRFDIAVDKTDPYAGEEVKLTAKITIDSLYNLEGLDLNLDRLEGFWVDSEEKNWHGNRVGEEIVFTRDFYLYPKRSGLLDIPNYPVVGVMSDGRNRLFFNESKRFIAYSNAIAMDVKPLPEGVTLVGNYLLNVKTDKFKTDAKGPVNLTIELIGKGNLDNFEGFGVDIPGVTVYGDKPVIKKERKKGEQTSRALYKFALVSDRDYVIPSFSVTFLDPISGEVKSVRSDEVAIEVSGSAPRTATIQKAATTEEKPKRQSDAGGDTATSGTGMFTLGMVLGLIFGILIPKLPVWFRQGRAGYEGTKTYPRRIESARTQKALLGLVIHHVDDPELKPLIQKLESSLDKEAFKAVKKEILRILKEKGELDVRSAGV